MVIELLRESGALLEGHFLLSSGKHSNCYFQCAKLLQYPDKASLAFQDVVSRIHSDIKTGKLKVDVIVGPAMGGIIAAWEIARQLSAFLGPTPAIFTERDENGIMVLRRGFEIQNGQNVLIVEDVVTTGKSSLECASVLEAKGANIAGLTCLVNRRSEESEPNWPFYSAVKLSVNNWDSSDCELCRQGIPLERPGSRKI
ncbi:MAG: orotate phosphoribosyltransferase [Treponema sp.]|jgi:orotate phosphoribosyltransferase|nr:orotate phosphoribosyltransferase [Treponema sp.]